MNNHVHTIQFEKRDIPRNLEVHHVLLPITSSSLCTRGSHCSEFCVYHSFPFLPSALYTYVDDTMFCFAYF